MTTHSVRRHDIDFAISQLETCDVTMMDDEQAAAKIRLALGALKRAKEIGIIETIVELSCSELRILKSFPDWQLRELGFMPESVTAECDVGCEICDTLKKRPSYFPSCS